MMMTTLLSTEIAEIGVRLCDDAYVVWCAAAAEAERALSDWFDATPGERVSRYLTYRAALDREEAAARDLQRLTELTGPCRDAIVAGRARVPHATAALPA
jgi:hypothetical protein